jgi:hypothetical protein
MASDTRGPAGGAERVAVLGAAAVLLVTWLFRWSARSRFPYEWDSAGYVLGAGAFDVYRHHPHPPGYPLYILSLKTARLFTQDLNTAQVVLAFAFTGAAALVTYLFARSHRDQGAAILASVLVLFAPPVALYDVIASTYPVDLLDSALVGWLAARPWGGRGAEREGSGLGSRSPSPSLQASARVAPP